MSLHTECFAECNISVIVESTPTLCSPLTFRAFKRGIQVPLGKIINPNSGLRSCSQFTEAVRFSVNYSITFEDIVTSVVDQLHSNSSTCSDPKKEKKLKFLTR